MPFYYVFSSFRALRHFVEGPIRPRLRNNQIIYLHGAAVALLSLLHEAVAADWRRHHTVVVGFVQQAAGLAVRQVPLVVAAAAAAERPGNIPAEEPNNRSKVTFSELDKVFLNSVCTSMAFFF